MEKLTEEDKRFSDAVINKFLEHLMIYGEVPHYLDFYRHCKLVIKNGDYFTYIYSYPDSEKCYKLYCPERVVNEAVRIYKEGRSLIKDAAEEILKRFGE